MDGSTSTVKAVSHLEAVRSELENVVQTLHKTHAQHNIPVIEVMGLTKTMKRIAENICSARSIMDTDEGRKVFNAFLEISPQVNELVQSIWIVRTESTPQIASFSSSCNISFPTKIFEVFEHQRWVKNTWDHLHLTSSDAPRWSLSAEGYDGANYDGDTPNIRLEPGCAWIGDWSVVKTADVDTDGWAYEFFGHWKSSALLISKLRRRKWTRTQCKAQVAEPASSPHSEIPYNHKQMMIILDQLNLLVHLVSGIKWLKTTTESLEHQLHVNEEKRQMERKSRDAEHQHELQQLEFKSKDVTSQLASLEAKLWWRQIAVDFQSKVFEMIGGRWASEKDKLSFWDLLESYEKAKHLPRHGHARYSADDKVTIPLNEKELQKCQDIGAQLAGAPHDYAIRRTFREFAKEIQDLKNAGNAVAHPTVQLDNAVKGREWGNVYGTCDQMLDFLRKIEQSPSSV